MPISDRPRVVVVGGSLGGVNAALWLREAGCEVEVFERTAAPLEDRGAGIVLNPATVRYLTCHGQSHLTGLSAATRWFRYLATDGSIAAEDYTPYRFTGYSVLLAGLMHFLGEETYHRGEECIGFEQDGTRVRVRFRSGRVEECDLLVFADGIRSTGRRLLFPDVHARYAGYVAWRGTIGEEELSAESFGILEEAISYAILPDSHALTYPIPDRHGTVEVGQRLTNWLWYRNVAAGDEIDDLLTDEAGIRHDISVSPAAIRHEHIQRLREDAAALPPAFQEMIEKTPGPFIQVVFDVGVPRMVEGRVCLLGDAAFVARPHAAAGTAKAAEDGRKLGEAIVAASGDVVEALTRWELDQLALGRQLVERSRAAGARLQGGGWTIKEPLPFGLYESGDSIFVE